MSPNGRRAWREWMRKANPRRKLRPPTHSICRLAREGRRHIGPIPPETPKPFTPRSLVGMSQKARKRLRHDRLFGPNVAPTKLLLADSLTVQLHIGERLRPCPGCFDCAVECWVCHEPHEPPDELCDGSGVIRAGKLRPLLRKRDCVFYID